MAREDENDIKEILHINGLYDPELVTGDIRDGQLKVFFPALYPSNYKIKRFVVKWVS